MKKHLLFVDDEAAIRGLTSLDLRRNGYEVTAVAGIEEAVSLLEIMPFNLVITDLLLPAGDGLKFLEMVKQRHPRLPVLVLTGMGFDNEAMREALGRGADGFVSKGLTMSHLRMEIDRVLKKAEAELDSIDDGELILQQSFAEKFDQGRRFSE
jgi:DNA-binding NtrC family response regulator